MRGQIRKKGCCSHYRHLRVVLIQHRSFSTFVATLVVVVLQCLHYAENGFSDFRLSIRHEQFKQLLSLQCFICEQIEA